MDASFARLCSRTCAICLVIAVCSMFTFSFFGCDRPTNPFYVPAEISYPDTLIVYVGTQSDTTIPELAKNVEVDSYTVAPELPQGITMDASTGAITGIPQGPVGVDAFTINAHNQWGISEDASIVIVVCPSAPRDLSASSGPGYAITLSWGAVNDANGYGLYRASDGDSEYVRVSGTTNTCYEDKEQIAPAAAYSYYVVAEHAETPPSRASDTVRVTVAPVVTIISPSIDTTVADTFIVVEYTVDGVLFSQIVLLMDGQNTVRVDTTTPTGLTGADTVFVTMDTVAPAAPVVHGASPTNNLTPTWSWTSDSAGAGWFRYELNSDTLSAACAETAVTSFTPVGALDEGTHTLYVWERDHAGNWSSPGSKEIVIDVSAPGAPQVRGISPTNRTQPTWTWSSGGGVAVFRIQLDNPDFGQNTAETSDTSFVPELPLAEGAHTLYVQERDSIGNWSSSGAFAITVDLTPPAAPVVNGPAQTADTRPVWTWSSGGGGNGTYRYRIDIDMLADTATVTTATSFAPDTDLNAGSHVLYVQECDGAGNWSSSGFHSVVVDTAVPRIVIQAPVLTRDSVVADDPGLSVSGTVHSSFDIASVTATLNGSPLAAGLTGKQWYLTLSSLRGTQWNEVVVNAADEWGSEGVYRFWVYGRFGLNQPAAPVIGERMCTALEVSWAHVEHCDHYIIWRREIGGALTQVASSLTATSITDSGLTIETAYEYYIRAYYERWDGSFTLSDTTPSSVAAGGSTVKCFTRTMNVYTSNLYDVKRTSDGGYIATGGGAPSVEIVRTDSDGAEVFLARNLTSYTPSLGISIAQTGSFFATIAAGQVPSVLAILVDANGSEMWENDYDVHGAGSAQSVAATLDSGIAVLCTQGLLRIKRNGDTLWCRTFEELYPAQQLASTADGGFGIAGTIVMKVDSVGQFVWGRPGPLGGSSYSVVRLSDGCFAVGGVGAVMKLTGSGDSLWTATLPSELQGINVDHIAEAADGDVVALLLDKSDPEAVVVRLARISPSGDVRWTRDVANGDRIERASMDAVPDGGFIFCVGNKLIKTDGRGNTLPE